MIAIKNNLALAKAPTGSTVSGARSMLIPTQASAVGTDPEYRSQGGWKVHITLSSSNYDSKAALLKIWLFENFDGIWKHLNGGEKYATDFTVYLGSRATMERFVELFERGEAINFVSQSKAGSSDCIVGAMGKLAARFDTKGSQHAKGNFDLYGRAGIPIAVELGDIWVFGDKEFALQASRKLLVSRYGDYFTGKTP